MDLREKELEEISFWMNSPTEGPSSFSIENISNKMSEAKWLIGKFTKYKQFYQNKKVFLELGGGQGWASCILKRFYLPQHSQVISSDIAKYALESTNIWERIFDIKIQTVTLKSYEIPFKDDSIDFIFTFQSAHHFCKYRSTLEEIYRVLRHGGACGFFFEPSCSRLMYPLSYRRVNKKRPSVPEDVIISAELLSIAEEIGFASTAFCDTAYVNRNPFETIYYYMLTKFKILRYLVPCTMDYILIK